MNYRAIAFAALQATGMYVAGFVPLIGQLIALFTPVPLIIAYARYGRTEGFVALGLSGALIAALAGWQAAAILLLSFGLMAIGTGEGLRRRLKPEQASLAGGLLPLAIIGGALAYYFLRIGKNPVVVMETYLRGSLAEATKLYTSMGLDEMASAINLVSDKFIYYFIRLTPGIVAATFILQAVCCYGLARVLILRMQKQAADPSQPTLASWHAPDKWVWGLILALGLTALPFETGRFIGLNFAILFSVVYTTQGVAVVEHVFAKAGLPAFVRGLLHALVLALPTVVFVIALGVVDIWADFRKVRSVADKT